MIKRYNNLSFVYAVPGIVLQIVGHVVSQGAKEPASLLLGVAILLIGTALLMVGIAYYAKSRGRSPVWCLMGLLSCIGLIVLLLLKDRAVETEEPTRPEEEA